MTDITHRFKAIFYPDSIAVVGASNDLSKGGARYLSGLIKAGYRGKLFPVNSNEREISGYKAYPTLTSIREEVDFVIISVPATMIRSVFEDCATKGVKAVEIFTAGFKESGTIEGIELENWMVEKARSAGFHIIGPNCIGIYNPSKNIPYGPMGILGKPGCVAIISQSGGHGGTIIKASITRGFNISKAVSFGNGSDLDGTDYLEYFTADKETRIIGAYLEGIRDGHKFFQIAQQLKNNKPLIVWKGGTTETGAIAAASHTGSLTSSFTAWSTALKQAGTIQVNNFEELVDTLTIFDYIWKCNGNRVAIVSGLVAGGGGDGVAATDLACKAGLSVPPFTPETNQLLRDVLPLYGTILRNPLDMGGNAGRLKLSTKVLNAVLNDNNIDVVIILEHIDNLYLLLGEGKTIALNELLISCRRNYSKPLLCVLPLGLNELKRVEMEKRLNEARIPTFISLVSAATAAGNLYKYWHNN